jgi:hypothetical protein
MFYPSLRKFVSDTPQPDEDKLLRYLRRGRREASLSGPDVKDELNPIPGEGIASGIVWMTDGVWVWQDSLDYYVETYHIRLPKSFVDNARRNKWQVPEK